jgi:forespore regulator of the sigma-K checkpoint
MQTTWFVRIMTLFGVVWVIFLADFALGGEIRKAFANQPAEEIKLPVKVDVVLTYMYVDGEISEETVTETIYSMENFWAKYDEWQFIGMEQGKFVFRKELDDISPLLKANGYFGVTEDGILTIFNGKPYKSHIISYYSIFFPN